MRASGGEIGVKGVDEGCWENPRRGSMFGSNSHGCDAEGGGKVAL